MMKKSILLTIFGLSLLPTNLHAEEIKITVKGMVCSFCAQGIKKTFLKKDNVQDIKVDLDNKLVEITTKTGTTIEDPELKNIISDAGYEILSISRS